MDQVRSLQTIQEKLQAGSFLLLKHSNTCPISQAAFDEFAAYANGHLQQPAGYIVVQENRDVSEAVASQFGIRHESPQAILFVKGEPVWHTSHYSINQETIEAEVAKYK